MIVKSAGATVTDTVVEWDFVPPLEDMVTWYVPIGVACKTVTLRVVLVLAPEAGVSMLLVSAGMIQPVPGETLVVKPVARSNPFRLVTVTVAVAIDPWFTFRLDGDAVSEKSL